VNPIELVMWLNGACVVLGDEPPSPEQWVQIRDKIGCTVGVLVADRLRASSPRHDMTIAVSNSSMGHKDGR
jgi:hypothetical protein